MNLKIVRTDSENEDFRRLVRLLDEELSRRDGDEHAFFAQFNKIDAIHHVVLAYRGERAVGCGAFKPFAGETAEIKRMYVLETERGRRVAALILAELEKWAAETGFTEAILETGFKQPEAIRLYEKSGYRVIPNYGQYEGVESSVCMSRKII